MKQSVEKESGNIIDFHDCKGDAPNTCTLFVFVENLKY